MSARFEGGVRFYTHGKAVINIPFPENEITCQNCILLKADYLLKRSICPLTNEIIPDPEYMIGGRCPLNFNEETINNEKEN